MSFSGPPILINNCTGSRDNENETETKSCNNITVPFLLNDSKKNYEVVKSGGSLTQDFRAELANYKYWKAEISWVKKLIHEIMNLNLLKNTFSYIYLKILRA